MPRQRGYLLVLGAAVLWGTTGTAQALGPDASNPLAVGALRMLTGGAGLLAVAAIAGRLPATRTWASPQVILTGAAMAFYQPFFFTGVARTGVAVGTLVALGTAPFLAGLMVRILRDEPATRRWLRATALASLGLALLLVGGGRTGVEPLGVLAALGAGAAYAAYTVSVKLVIQRQGALAAMTATFGWAAALSLPVLAVAETGWLAAAGGWALILYLGLVTTAMAYLLFSRGLATTAVRTATTLTLAEPAVAAVLGVALLGERLRALSWVGLGLLASALGSLRREGAAV